MTTKDYRKIECSAGSTIDSAVEKLRKYKELGDRVIIEFNGKTLYSDVDDLESAYKKITGRTKYEFDEMLRKDREESEERKRKHKEAIPELIKEWIEKGNLILDEKYHEYWNKVVPVRLNDLYEGMELNDCIEIVTELNTGCSLDEAKSIIESQDHSGMSFSLVCSMVKAFCERGNEFSEYINQPYIAAEQ